MCVCVCVCVHVCCRAEQPVLLSAWTAAVQTSAPGSWLDSGRMQEVSRMKYDLNGSRWNGKYHIRGVQYMSPCPKDTGLHYTPALMYLWEFQCLLWRTLPMLWCVHQYHATSLCFFFFFCCLWTQHGELITVASFVCLRRSAGQQRNSEWIVSACFVGFCPIWKTGEINVFSIFGAETRLSTIDLWLSEWCH